MHGKFGKWIEQVNVKIKYYYFFLSNTILSYLKFTIRNSVCYNGF